MLSLRFGAPVFQDAAACAVGLRDCSVALGTAKGQQEDEQQQEGDGHAALRRLKADPEDALEETEEGMRDRRDGAESEDAENHDADFWPRRSAHGRSEARGAPGFRAAAPRTTSAPIV